MLPSTPQPWCDSESLALLYCNVAERRCHCVGMVSRYHLSRTPVLSVLRHHAASRSWVGSGDMTAPRERIHERGKHSENLVKSTSCEGLTPSKSKRGASNNILRSDQKDRPRDLWRSIVALTRLCRSLAGIVLAPWSFLAYILVRTRREHQRASRAQRVGTRASIACDVSLGD